MIRYTTGNLLEANVEALVNAVNTVGVMGKGIALQFREQFPSNFRAYQQACKAGTLHTGDLLIVEDGSLMYRKTIINFPTKAHWRGASRYEYITSGLIALRSAILERDIKSIAIPPLGCGNGGLHWEKVRPMIEEHLKDLDAEIIIYTPNDQIKR